MNANPIALFKEIYDCQLTDRSVSICGIKHSHYTKSPLLANLIIHAECSGEHICKLDLKAAECPKKTNLNKP